MINIILLAVSMTAALMGNILRKYYTDRNSNLDVFGGSIIFNIFGSIIATVCLLITGGFNVPSWYTVGLGAIFGAVTALQGITNVAALCYGPISYTSVIISFSTLLSALSGAVLFGESISGTQIIGIVLMLISFAVAPGEQSDTQKRNKKWLGLCIIAFLATGFIGIIQKIHQSTIYKDELDEMLIISFAVSSIICMCLTVFQKRKKRDNSGVYRNLIKQKKFILIVVGYGVCIAVNNKFNLYLSGVIDSAVFFPLVNGGGLVLSTVAAILLFREKLSKKQWIGVGLGIISVLFLCMSF